MVSGLAPVPVNLVSNSQFDLVVYVAGVVALKPRFKCKMAKNWLPPMEMLIQIIGKHLPQLLPHPRNP
ncbi:hypothetical protein ES703_05964 [subsurface metagenome]